MTDGELSTTDVVTRTAKPILEIGRAWMMDPTTPERGAEIGVTGQFGFWTIGRAGVLGPVHADVATAALGFMAPEQIAGFWDSCPENLTPQEVNDAYVATIAAWGEKAFASVDDAVIERGLLLAERVVSAAQASTGTLFAAWRLVDRPEGIRGRLTVVLQILRELRGGAHLSAVHAAGLGPLGSIMSTDDPVRGGAPWAERFGWKPPYPEPDLIRRAQAEAMTTTICEHAYSILTPAEGAEFIDIVTSMRSLLD